MSCVGPSVSWARCRVRQVRWHSLFVIGAAVAFEACRLAIPGVIPGTACDADARTDDADWWRAAEPLKAMDRVTRALKLKVDASDRATALKERAEAAGDACRKQFFDGFGNAHAAVEKAIAELESFKTGRPRSAYDPELAHKSFSTYCDAAYEMELFISKLESCAK